MTERLVLMSVEIFIIFDLKQFFRKRDFSNPVFNAAMSSSYVFCV